MDDRCGLQVLKDAGIRDGTKGRVGWRVVSLMFLVTLIGKIGKSSGGKSRRGRIHGCNI